MTIVGLSVLSLIAFLARRALALVAALFAAFEKLGLAFLGGTAGIDVFRSSCARAGSVAVSYTHLTLPTIYSV